MQSAVEDPASPAGEATICAVCPRSDVRWLIDPRSLWAFEAVATGAATKWLAPPPSTSWPIST